MFCGCFFCYFWGRCYLLNWKKVVELHFVCSYLRMYSSFSFFLKALTSIIITLLLFIT